MSARGLDWAGLMRAGMGPPQRGGLGLLPQDFWSLSPGELALLLGVQGHQGAMTRGRLEELSNRFPDLPGKAAG
ncbi:phage tail assembly chaperone [Paracoccus ravus]|uniref:phage tail assembly chaperone n=1 Tax=Paracoccus ravus TaxID=2447760 RepID=UPI00106EA746|nr:phage tail assembly chaperone [Paracoccus ravus]